jgi:hypothetical protein
VKCGRARREKKLRKAPGRAARPREVMGKQGAAGGGRWCGLVAADDGGTTWQGGEKPAGVGRAVGGRAGGPGGAVRAARGSWQPGRSPARGGGRCISETKREGRERKMTGTCSQFFKSSRDSL